jgi:enoyl-CoA hydratase
MPNTNLCKFTLLSDSPMDLLLDKNHTGVWTLSLNLPSKLNALNDAMVQNLHHMLAEIDCSEDCKVLIFTGEGRGFCAGFDLSLADQAPGSEHGEAAAWTRRQENFASLVTRLKSLHQPVIAAINGPANGAGFGLSLACDIRLASTLASFNAAFIKVGMSSCDIGVSYLLPRSVGTAQAFDIMLTGRMVDAEEALRIGLISRLTAPDSLLEHAHTLGMLIAANDDFAVWMTKRGMWANLEASSLQAALELENRTQILTRTTGVLKSKAQSFKKRQA